MLEKIIALLLFLSGVLLFQQDEYKLEFERMEMGRYNKDHISHMNVVTYKYNRTTPVANLTFTSKTNLGSDLQVVVQNYNFLSNEYRIFPLRFQFNFCDAIHDNEFGLKGLLNCGNFSKCAVGVGKYNICKWSPDATRFPPHVPDGRYKIELQILYVEVEIMVLNLYGRIHRPEVTPRFI